MGIGLVTYISVGLYVGWIPLQAGAWAITGTIVIAVVVSFLIWFGFYLYYRQEAKRINAKLKEKTRDLICRQYCIFNLLCYSKR